MLAVLGCLLMDLILDPLFDAFSDLGRNFGSLDPPFRSKQTTKFVHFSLHWESRNSPGAQMGAQG